MNFALQPFMLNVLCLIVFNNQANLIGGTREIRFKVKEEQTEGTVVGSLADSEWLRSMLSTDVHSSLRYTFLTSVFSQTDMFSINSKTGVVLVSGRVDREQLCGLYLTICDVEMEAAVQSTVSQFFRVVNVVVEVEDVNDNSPHFPQAHYVVKVPEDAHVNYSMALMAAQDIDLGKNGALNYRLLVASMTSSVTLKSSSRYTFKKSFDLNVDVDGPRHKKVSLIVTLPLDREQQEEHHFVLEASDGGSPPLVGSMTITVRVLDVNDNRPMFHPRMLSVTLDEATAVGSVIARLNISDIDSDANGELNFRFSPVMPPEVTRYFTLNNSTGELRLVVPLTELKIKARLQLQIECSDGGQPPLVGESEVMVLVEHSGNSRPRIFLSLLFGGNMSEYAHAGTAVAHIRVLDPDSGLNGVVSCSVVSEVLELQALDVNLYKVIVVKSLDRETTAAHETSIRCHDAGSPSMHVVAHFTVHVLDENDNAPKFDKDVYYSGITENNQIGVQITRVFAQDIDIGVNGHVDYSVTSPSGDAGILVDESGYVIATTSFDHEKNHQLSFQIAARDRGKPMKQSTATVILTITDVNDISPVFKRDYYELSISENTAVGTTVGRIVAEDADSNENGRLRYSLSLETPYDQTYAGAVDAYVPLFVSPEGILTLERQLDREITQEYNLLAFAVDNGDSPRTGTARISVQVEDVNDNAPQIVVPDPRNISSLTLPTNAKPGSTLLVVVARDVDQRDLKRLRYHLARTPPFVSLNSQNGVFTLSRPLKPQDVGKHRVTVVVTDSGTPPKASNASFDIIVFIANHSGYGGGRGDKLEHLLIVVILGCVTGVITVAVIITIFIIRRSDGHHRKYGGKRHREIIKQCPVQEKHEREVDNVIVASPPDEHPTLSCPDYTPVVQQNNSVDGDNFNGQTSFEPGSVLQKTNSASIRNEFGGNNTWNKTIRAHHDLLKKHGIDEGLLLQPEDGTSDVSGESTTCDSGRGGSEEECHSAEHHSPSSNGRRIRDYRGHIPKTSRHLSTFHPGNISRPTRVNFTLPLPHLQETSGLSRNDTTDGSAMRYEPYSCLSVSEEFGSTPITSYTENGQPVKKVSFYEDVIQPKRSPLPEQFQAVLRTESTKSLSSSIPEPAPPENFFPCVSFTNSPHTVLLSGSHPSIYHQQQQYANILKRGNVIYSNITRPQRIDFDSSADNIEDNASTTTSGSYHVDVELSPLAVCSLLTDQNTIV